MSENVKEFPGEYYGDIDPKDVLEGAIEAELDSVIVIGTRGETIYSAYSQGSMSDSLHLLELAKMGILMESFE